MLRGIDGRAVFEDNRDRSRFCLLLQEAAERHSFRVHGFCFMTNHIHLLIEPGSEALHTGVHRFVSRYAQHFNKRHSRKGYVFQGRFRSVVVQDGVYMKRLIRYIHLNPLEAGLVKTPKDYPWCSHNAYFGRAVFIWLETDRVLFHFAETPSEALAKLSIFMNAKAKTSEDAETIRSAFRSGVYGSEKFTRVFSPNHKQPNIKIGRRVSLEELVDGVCDRFEVNVVDLSSGKRSPHIVHARAVLARLCQQLECFCLNDASSVLNKHRSSVSRLASFVTKSPQLSTIASELLQSFG